MADGTRVLVLEVADMDSEDRISMALATWTRDNPEKPIRCRQLYSCPVGDPGRL